MIYCLYHVTCNLSAMPKTNEATDTDLKVIERFQRLGWKRVDIDLSAEVRFKSGSQKITD